MKKYLQITTSVLALLLLFVAAMPATRAQAGGPDPVVIMDTSMGRIIVQLYPEKTPITVENFLRYVDNGFYDGTIFHRIIRQGTADAPGRGMNIVQGGGLDSLMLEKRVLWRPIPLEDATGLDNARGTIAMARTSDPNSATSQFFFNVYDNDALNPVRIANSQGTLSVKKHGYCAFGKVLRGMEVLEEMLKVKTGKKGVNTDVPLQPVYLKKAYRAQ